VDRQGSQQAQNYTKSMDYAKKLIAQYPRSKWVDDAYLLWARGLIGTDDPLQCVTMLQGFETRFPRTDQRADATFFLGLAYRNARRYTQAVDAFDEFLLHAPRNDLVPFAHYERSRALLSLKRYGEAAEAAGQVVTRFPHHELVDRALRQRAEARLLNEDFDGARADFRDIGLRATSDADRFTFLMREVDCLEAARKYDEELTVLRDELSHTPPPPTDAQTGAPIPPGADKFGKLTLRIGTAELLSGRLKEALEQYGHVLTDYPKTALSAEAQYRTGYAYETSADDFDRALQEYAKVKEQFGLTQYTQQAQSRSEDLGRIMQFRKGTGADSLEKKAEAGFLTAERYLFELKRPERALEEYANVSSTYAGTAVAGRALNAQAWVLSRRMNRNREADSLFWKVVREYPATEAQLAARDYLEADGQVVPDSLIKMPVPRPAPVDTAKALTPVPPTPPLGANPALARPDSLRLRGPIMGEGGGATPRGFTRDSLGRTIPVFPGAGADSLGRGRGLFAPATPPPPPADSTGRGGSAPGDTTGAGNGAPADTSKRGGRK
jgi:tetratricopeptide (TPR) repeat protein